MLLFVANWYVAYTVPIESCAGLRLISASETADTAGNGGDSGGIPDLGAYSYTTITVDC